MRRDGERPPPYKNLGHMLDRSRKSEGWTFSRECSFFANAVDKHTSAMNSSCFFSSISARSETSSFMRFRKPSMTSWLFCSIKTKKRLLELSFDDQFEIEMLNRNCKRGGCTCGMIIVGGTLAARRFFRSKLSFCFAKKAFHDGSTGVVLLIPFGTILAHVGCLPVTIRKRDLVNFLCAVHVLLRAPEPRVPLS